MASQPQFPPAVIVTGGVRLVLFRGKQNKRKPTREKGQGKRDKGKGTREKGKGIR